MELRMSEEARRELIWSQAHRYQHASRAEKGLMLREFCEATGMNRKYAIGVLLHPPLKGASPRHRSRNSRYAGDVEVIERLWDVSGRLCSKRLVSAIPLLVDALVEHGEMEVSPQVRERLVGISASTLDRLLRSRRRALGWRGKSTTRPGTLLRDQIPIRTFADWNENTPGFFEADLVSHCGGVNSGEYANTLDMTETYTGWTELEVLPNRSQKTVCDAIERIRRRIPFPMLGVDSDNGSEFINAHLQRYCGEHDIVFTRCRPYRKNDQCHVESKNWSVVRVHAGYFRYDTPEAIRALEILYSWLRLSVNYLRPSMKLVQKVRHGSKVTKRYDRPATPCERLLAAGILGDEAADRLRQQAHALNPALIDKRIKAATALLRRAASVI